MAKYAEKHRVLVAVDCIIFGFDGLELKLLVVQRALEPQLGSWSLMGGFIQEGEDPDDAASRVLHKLTGLSNV